jgi:hypothetical protein
MISVSDALILTTDSLHRDERIETPRTKKETGNDNLAPTRSKNSRAYKNKLLPETLILQG